MEGRGRDLAAILQRSLRRSGRVPGCCNGLPLSPVGCASSVLYRQPKSRYITEYAQRYRTSSRLESFRVSGMPCRRQRLPCSQCHWPGLKRSREESPNKKDAMKLTSPPPKNGWSQSQDKDLPEWAELMQKMQRKPLDLSWLSGFVRRNEEKRLPFPGDRKWHIRLCDLDGTIYSGQTHMLESWQKLYLPQPIRMQVLGVLETNDGSPPIPEWVTLVAEDGRIYVYGEEELTLVAESPEKLLQGDLNLTGTTYSYPDISDEDEEELRKDPEIQKIRQRADDFIEESAAEFEDFLAFCNA